MLAHGYNLLTMVYVYIAILISPRNLFNSDKKTEYDLIFDYARVTLSGFAQSKSRNLAVK